MHPALTGLLLVIFLVHLVVFLRLGIKRRQRYYIALVVTFSLLTAAMAVRLVLPDAQIGGDFELHRALQVAAWPAAAVSIGWTLLRLRGRLTAK